jgi:thioredoxin reductase/Pyruvate/2-oxoacid:ferredoxin oxidoreductase delta subunit
MPGFNFSSTFSIVLALAPVVGLVLGVLLLLYRRLEVSRYERSHKARAEAIEHGSHKARLLHPDIDLTNCIGCGACIRACPEDGVLDLLHGQAVVVHGIRCVGHARCAEVCPTGAIALTFGDLSDRKDLPAISEEFEAIGVPGLFIAGELSGFSLVRTAISHGTTVAEVVSRRLAESNVPSMPDIHDLLIVGLGPAGLACSLRATELGVNFHVIEQAEAVGGTVASYPRKKMVMTQPMRLPMHGKMTRLEYMKEDLVGLWSGLIADHKIPVQTGVRLTDVKVDNDGFLTAITSDGPKRARYVCLCLGRRGTPRKLGVPGEELPKVLYHLLDAESYHDRNILVVGGGDSAAEAAVGLCEGKRNTVWLCSRSRDWTKVKSKNEKRINKAVAAGELTLLMETNSKKIEAGSVTLVRKVKGVEEEITIPNDDMFILAGGDPPFSLLERAGVSFDQTKRASAAVMADSGNSTPLLWAMGLLLVVAAMMINWAVLHFDFYGASVARRTLSNEYMLLRPSGKFGLGIGILSIVLFAWNLLYLVRRNPKIGRYLPGSLKMWMGTHVFTGLASFLCVIVHAGLAYRMTVGGFALISLLIVLLSGLLGRYFYAIVPHAANGREMNLNELRVRLATMATTWDVSARGPGQAVRDRVESLIRQDRWRPSLVARIVEMVAAHFRLRKTLRDLRQDPKFQDIPEVEREELLVLAKRSYRLTLQIAHFEEIRAVLGSWRFIHRWLAVLMLFFVIAHVVTAVRYARLDWPLPASWLQSISGGTP